MTGGPPSLHDDDVALELKEYLSSDRAHYHFAFFGTRKGPGKVDIEGYGEYQIEPVRCELELRERFAELGDTAPRVAWLVPFQGHVPHDLRHNFAKSGTVRTVGASARLRRLFGTPTLEAGLEANPLAHWLVQEEVAEPAGLRVGAQRLTAAAMWSAWFGAETGIVGLTDLSLAQWLLRCAEHGGGPGMQARLAPNPAGKRVIVAFEAHIARLFGAVGKAALAAWYTGRATELLQLGVISSALLEADDAASRMWLAMKLKAFGLGEAATFTELRDAADQVLHEMSRAPTARDSLATLLRFTEAAVDHPEVRVHLARHRWLPIGFRSRLDRLGALLEQALASPGTESFQRAMEADAALAQHHHYAEYGREDADRARMALRLVSFLQRAATWQAELPLGDPDASHRLAAWYAQEGGYVDIARHLARTSDDSPFGRGVRAVVAQVDALRRALDHRFARGLALWLGTGATGGPVQLIQNALAHMLQSALAKHPERRALVLLMDGMGWAECTALLRSAAESQGAFAPVALNRELSLAAGVLAGTVHGVPTLAAIPTITKVSRSAFFEGKLPTSGREVSSGDDPKRFASHPVVTELNGGRPARLLLRADGHSSDGQLSSDARTLLRDINERVVGLVVNAIDASLSGDSQQLHQWTLSSVRSLAAIFEEAGRAGRMVLFSSDHGHVRSTDLLKTPIPDKVIVGGERWRGAAADESHATVRDGAPGAPLTFECKLVWAPPGASGVTVLSDERGRHTRHPHVGEHGGATLAEVVAPCLWLAAPEPAQEGSALETQPLFVPDWWLLRMPPASTDAVAKPDAALTLPGVDVQTRLRPTSSRPRKGSTLGFPVGSLAAALGRNELFKARATNELLRERTLRAIHFLEQREGLASLQDLADALEQPFYRINGLLSHMQRVLNLEGEPVLERPTDSNQVQLNMPSLKQQFEVGDG